MNGAAAAMGEYSKEEEYCRDIDDGAYALGPLVMDPGGRLGKGVMHLINRLAKIADSAAIFARLLITRIAPLPSLPPDSINSALRSMCLCGACKRR